ncbi:SDR family oxidoreductase [Hymenobacter terrenus]|uniref:SDR family oxidoreductase n=1 Tax=Hymenobacter terrenus TaxID=1629124 RepID=UPI000619B457|nr:SDR family oxidoreductase [Hymenobacter terrenus]
MRVFVTGATGFIGSAIIQELLGAGHQVLGLARSEAAAQALAAAGAEAHWGTLDDFDSLRRGAAVADGVIHTAFVHDFSAYANAGETDRRAVEALGTALVGSDRPFVVTSGVAVLTPGRLGTETDATNPTAAAAPRIPSEEAVLALAAQGVRASVVRLPPSVHGDGDHAFVPTLISIARDKGVSAYVGDGRNRWSAVHRLDAARLFRLALEQGTAGARYHGIADEGVAVRDLAGVIGRRLNLPVVAKSPEEAADHFGWLADFLGIDCPASSALTQQQLGWHPSQPTLLADLEQGRYFEI